MAYSHPLPMPTYRRPQPEQMLAFYRDLLERVNALPGTASSSVSTGMAVSGANFVMDFNIVGKEIADPSRRPGAGFNMVSSGYFPTFGIRIIRGRAFTEADTSGGMHVAIVNSELVRKYLPDVDHLTQRVSVVQIIPVSPNSDRRFPGRLSAFTKMSGIAIPRTASAPKFSCPSRKVRGRA